jgi:hypothetical protein
MTGVARRSSPFEPGPDGDRAPAVIERRSPFPAAAHAMAAQFIDQHMPFARPKDVTRERLAAALDPRRQAALDRNPDYRAAAIQAERDHARQQAVARPAVMLSNPMTASDGEDVYGPIAGSLGIRW